MTMLLILLPMSVLCCNGNENYEKQKQLMEREKEILYSNTNAPVINKSPSFSVREISDILPEFDPVEKTNNAREFISRIIALHNVYQWDEKLFLFAAQSKLRGYAKLWCDSQANVFCNFNNFAIKLQQDFPSRVVEADIHIEMLKKTRKPNESVDEYFYQMCAIGRKGKLSESSMIKYIRNGLNYTSLQNAIAGIEFYTLNDLHSAMSRYSENCISIPRGQSSHNQLG